MIWWKGFTAEEDTWKRKKNLKSTEELIKEFEKGGVEIRRQEREGNEYRRIELPRKHIAK